MALELHDITKTVDGRLHIKPVSLRLEPGHFNVLLGETGAGKTSLIKLMAGLDPVSGGRIVMNGADVTGVSTQKRRISLVHQFFVNYPNMNVFDNIASPLRVAGMSRDEVQARVEETAQILQLRPFLKRRPHELSGGQQQRVALARAIAKDSLVVFLDEPLANLDYKLREELREQLPELFAGRGAVVVYATSEPEEALMLGGATALMEDGRVTQFGPTAEIYRNPASLASAAIFSNPPINRTRVTKTGATIRLNEETAWPATGPAATLPDGAYQMAIRPHNIVPEQTGRADVALTARILVTELSGSESTAHFTIGTETWVSQSAGVHPYQVGDNHRFFMDATRCLYFGADGRAVG